ncbi:hypothetical protein SLEP1_g13864 [Rubroshorea leprosula]|uniref:Shugoshin C-terminal domain-containing protein n=1 Tax=Rubroshorea leprosula TaxID=152421 RepID=A0AAV5ILQ7_9ROSI|nr:hypothetical protein SLEP1_g13864 [Rubroshorea leprosula]
MKGERMAKRSSFGSMVRRRLSDITNSQAQPKSSKQEEKPARISPTTDDYINQLIKEKMAMMKLIEERNKIIELSGMELKNMKVSLQKLQMQNWNLAQSNSQMLAEINLGRERMKALQHELVCRDALLKAMNLEKKEGEECQNKEADADDKPCKGNRRRNVRSQSMGPSTTCRRAVDKERTENKRRCLRRQSAMFKSKGQEKSGNLFEIVDAATFAVNQTPDTPMHVKEETRVSSRRCSVGRPLRRAVEKVQSYKEVPLNVKMRR